MHELRYAVRSLRQSPGFTLAAVLTLALGIGANTALFSIVYGVLFRPLDYRDPDRLVAIVAERQFAGRPRNEPANFSLPNLEIWQARARSFESIAMSAGSSAGLTTGAGMEVVNVATVTPSFFSTVDGRFALGRPLGPGDDNAPVVVISTRLWQRRFGGSSTVLGQELSVDRQPYTIVGVVDATFQVPRAQIDVWRPVGFVRTLNPAMAGPRAGGFQAFARLKPDAGIDRARAESETLAQALDSNLHATAVPLRDRITAGTTTKPTLIVLFAAVGLVLLVACANVTNLILARNASRSRETAVRLALGASRSRLVRQALMHSALIAAGGGGLGVAMAMSIVNGVIALGPSGIPRLDAIRVDLPVLLFAAAVSIATTLAVGILPSWQSTDVMTVLKHGSPGAGGSRGRRLRRVLIVAEVAISVVLLVGASLLGRSLVRLLQTDIGVTNGPVTAALVDLTFGRRLSMTEQRLLIDRIVDRVGTLPGVVVAGAGASMPPNLARLRITTNQNPAAPGELPANYSIDVVTSTPGYFSALGLRLQSGRLFSDADDGSRPQVMILTRSTARQLFGDVDPIGRTFGLPILTPTGMTNGPVAVVGVVDDVKYSGLETPANAVIYRPFAQQPWPSMFIVARTTREIENFAPTLGREIAAVDSGVGIQSVDTLASLISGATAQPRFRAVVLVAIAALALILAAVGLYGVVAYTVAQRTAEIGIRMALGAASGDVVRLVLREGMWLAALGLALGIGAARMLARFVGSLLFGIPPTDAVSFAAAAALLLAIALLASYLPARRASRVDPLIALRSE